jgi:hypothetical protein
MIIFRMAQQSLSGQGIGLPGFGILLRWGFLEDAQAIITTMARQHKNEDLNFTRMAIR